MKLLLNIIVTEIEKGRMGTMLILVIIFLVVLLFAIFLTAFFVRRWEEERLGEYQDKILKTQREEVQNIYKTMRGWRHDYHNHMQKIKAHLALNQIEEVKVYLYQL